jgi:hypothetical protein
MSFLIDFWPLNTVPLELLQKIQDDGDIKGVINPFIHLKNSKSEIFQKVHPRFVVLKSKY